MAHFKQQLHKNWHFKQVTDSNWASATVPGCVHLDLMAHGIIEDPFYGENENRCQWIEYKDWEYKTTFEVDHRMLELPHQLLYFEGLDTYATVFLNGEEVLSANNMHRVWKVDVLGKLSAGENEILIRFDAAVNKALHELSQIDYRYFAVQDDAQQASSVTRKAPYHYGWDWGPRLVTAGIWKSVYLLGWQDIRIENIYFQTLEINEDSAQVEAEVTLSSSKAMATNLAIRDQERGIQLYHGTVQLEDGLNQLKIPIIIHQPEIWWPAGMGAQPLYQLHYVLENESGSLANFTQTVGIRTIELRQTTDQWGASFEFVVNGSPMFAKGGNWIPADNFLTRVDEQVYEDWIVAAKAAHFNMLRVWGGGIYEQAAFYEQCDQHGILVWQDFMFACSLFPADKAFLENVRQEAIDNVIRLRSHPSLALWCGDNENEWIYDFSGTGMNSRFGLSDETIASYQKRYISLLDCLNGVVKAFDPSRYFWPSSPSSEGKDVPNSEGFGDMHHWDIWHMGQPIAGYKELKPRFISEFGFQGMPTPVTVNTYSEPKDQFIGSPVMAVHQKHKRGYELIQHYLNTSYPSPKDFDGYIYLTQILQAETMKLATEHFRSLMPHCMGVLYWQYNDCWPVCSWSSVDYFLRWKALHYFAKKFFAPTLVYLNIVEGQVQITVVHEGREELIFNLEWALKDFWGEVIHQGGQESKVSPNTVKHLTTLTQSDLLAGNHPAKSYLAVYLKQGTKVIAQNLLYFVSPQLLQLQQVPIQYEVQVEEEKVLVHLVSSTLAKNVRLNFPSSEGHFSDNFFDLEAKIPQTIEYYPKTKISEVLQVHSMIDLVK